MRGGPYVRPPGPQQPGRRRRVEADDGPEQDRPRLAVREDGDQGQGALGREGLQRLQGGVPGAGEVVDIVVQQGRTGAAPAAAQMVDGAVVRDRPGPCREAGARAVEPAQVPHDVQPAVRCHVLRVRAHQPGEIGEQRRLDGRVHPGERRLLAPLGPADRSLQRGLALLVPYTHVVPLSVRARPSRTLPLREGRHAIPA